MAKSIPSLEVDPCGRARALQEIRDKIVAGQGVAETELEQGNGTRRRVKYSPANLSLLEREIAAAEALCPSMAGRRRRFAIGGRP